MDALVVGRTYRVRFDDCCVLGEFTSTLVEFVLDEDGDPDVAIFEHGRAERLYSSSWVFTEVT